MYMIEITEDKVSDISQHLEKGLHCIGKAMQCIESLSESRSKRYEEDEEEPEYRSSRMRSRYSRY